MPMLENIDVDGLLEMWAELWVRECSSRTMKAWYDATGQNEKTIKSEGFKTRVRREFPDCIWPPRVEISCIDDPIDRAAALAPHADPTALLKLENAQPEILFAFDDATHDPQFESLGNGSFHYAKTYTKSTSVSTNRVFTSKLTLDLKIPAINLGIGGEFSLELSKGSNTVEGEAVVINQTITQSDPNKIFLLEAMKSRCTVKRLIILSGYVVVASKKKINPGVEYTQTIGGSHKKWVVPIYKVFQDLKKFQQQHKLPSKLESSLEAFEIDLAKKQVISHVECHCEVTHDIKLVSRLKAEVKERFEQQLALYRQALLEYNQQERKIERLFYGEASLQTYYADLTVLKGSDYQKLERELKEQDQDSRETSRIYNQMTGASGSGIECKKLLPPQDTPEYKGKWHVLITGTAGVGKTTLSKRLASIASDWCFYIPIRNLVADRYSERADKPYTLAEILIREGYPLDLSERLLPLLANNLWQIYLEAIATGDQGLYQQYFVELTRSAADFQAAPSTIPRALIILDGYDEKNIPSYLEPIFKRLMSCAQVILTSRPYNLSTLNKDYQFIPEQSDQWVEVTGFSPETMEKYINDFFASLSFLSEAAKSEYVIKLRQHLGRAPYIAAACKIPVNCEMVCTAWASGTFDEKILTMSGLYHALLEALSQRYVAKFKKENFPISVEDLDKGDIKVQCQYEVAFAEYFAFNSLVNRELFSDTVAAKEYLPEEVQAQALIQQKQFGFIKPSSEYGHSGQGKYYFSHLTFRDFFAARYIAHCLQQASGSVVKKISTYPHRFFIADASDEIKDVKSFIQQRKYEASFEYVMWFTVGILAENLDVTTLDYFFDCLLGEPEDLVGFYPSLILVRCLDEAQPILDKLNDEIKTSLFKVVQQWLSYSFSTDAQETQINPLWERLRLSKNLLQRPEMQSYFKIVISSLDESSLLNAIKFFSRAGFISLEIVEEIIKKLAHIDSDQQQHCSILADIIQNNPELLDPMIEKYIDHGGVSDSFMQSVDGPRRYIRHEIDVYRAFNVEPVDLPSLLSMHQHDEGISELLQGGVRDILLEEAFFQYLQQRELIDRAVSRDTIGHDFERYANDAGIQAAFAAYMAQGEELLDSHKVHPAILKILACIKKQELHIWRLGEHNELLPYTKTMCESDVYADYKPQNAQGRIDLLFMGNNYFACFDFARYEAEQVSPFEMETKLTCAVARVLSAISESILRSYDQYVEIYDMDMVVKAVATFRAFFSLPIIQKTLRTLECFSQQDNKKVKIIAVQSLFSTFSVITNIFLDRSVGSLFGSTPLDENITKCKLLFRQPVLEKYFQIFKDCCQQEDGAVKEMVAQALKSVLSCFLILALAIRSRPDMQSYDEFVIKYNMLFDLRMVQEIWQILKDFSQHGTEAVKVIGIHALSGVARDVLGIAFAHGYSGRHKSIDCAVLSDDELKAEFEKFNTGYQMRARLPMLQDILEILQRFSDPANAIEKITLVQTVSDVLLNVFSRYLAKPYMVDSNIVDHRLNFTFDKGPFIFTYKTLSEIPTIQTIFQTLQEIAQHANAEVKNIIAQTMSDILNQAFVFAFYSLIKRDSLDSFISEYLLFVKLPMIQASFQLLQKFSAEEGEVIKKIIAKSLCGILHNFLNIIHAYSERQRRSILKSHSVFIEAYEAYRFLSELSIIKESFQILQNANKLDIEHFMVTILSHTDIGIEDEATILSIQSDFQMPQTLQCFLARIEELKTDVEKSNRIILDFLILFKKLFVYFSSIQWDETKVLLLNLVSENGRQPIQWEIAVVLLSRGEYNPTIFNTFLTINESLLASESKQEFLAILATNKALSKAFGRQLEQLPVSSHMNLSLLSMLLAEISTRTLLTHIVHSPNNRPYILAVLIQRFVNDGQAVYIKNNAFWFYERGKCTGLPIHGELLSDQIKHDIREALRLLNLSPDLFDRLIIKQVPPVVDVQPSQAWLAEHEELKRQNQALQSSLFSQQSAQIKSIKAEADDYYASAHSHYILKNKVDAIKFFKLAKTKYKELLREPLDDGVKQKTEKRITKLTDGKYSSDHIAQL